LNACTAACPQKHLDGQAAGVGKTVLLDRMRDDAEAAGITVRIEAPESRSLPALLAPQLRQTLLRLSHNEQARDLAQRALRALAGLPSAEVQI
jgi:hypothetical protein